MRCCPECGSTHYSSEEEEVWHREYNKGKMTRAYILQKTSHELVYCKSCKHSFNPYQESDWGHTK